MPRSARQISEDLDISVVSACHTLRRIIRQENSELEVVELNREAASKILGPKTIRRTRFFFFSGIFIDHPFQEFLE